MVWMMFRRSNEWLIQDDSNHTLYSTMYRPKVDADVKYLYRQSPDIGNRIGTIQYISDTVWLIKRDSNETGWFFQTPCFDYGDGKFCWSGRSKLTSSAGLIILQFTKGSWWSYTKVGDLKMVEMEEDMREIVFATMIAMDWGIRIQVAAEAARLAECRNICEEEHNRICENRNKNDLQVQREGKAS